VVFAAALALPSAASATVTIGSNLNRVPGTPDPFGSGTTSALAGLSSGAAAAGGITSPVNGAVTVWRIRSGLVSGPTSADMINFRVIRPLGGGLFTGAGMDTVNPAENVISAFSTRKPISIGDYIGIDCCPAGPTGVYFVENSGTVLRWWPNQADGDPGRPPDTTTSLELAINADIEPTSTFEVEKVEKLKKGKLELTVALPNAGTLIVGDRRDPKTGATAAAKKNKKKKKLLRRTTTTVTSPGEISLRLKPTKAARKRMKAKARRTGKKHPKIKAKVGLAFTPVFGTSPGTGTMKTKLRR